MIVKKNNLSDSPTGKAKNWRNRDHPRRSLAMFNDKISSSSRGESQEIELMKRTITNLMTVINTLHDKNVELESIIKSIRQIGYAEHENLRNQIRNLSSRIEEINWVLLKNEIR